MVIFITGVSSGFGLETAKLLSQEGHTVYGTVRREVEPLPQVHYLKGTKAMLIEAFDGNKYCCVNDTDVYALELIPQRHTISKNIDAEKPMPKVKVRKRPIPTMKHPWRKMEFGRFVRKNRYEHKFEDVINTTENLLLSEYSY